MINTCMWYEQLAHFVGEKPEEEENLPDNMDLLPLLPIALSRRQATLAAPQRYQPHLTANSPH
jgi:hypothetical protein